MQCVLKWHHLISSYLRTGAANLLYLNLHLQIRVNSCWYLHKSKVRSHWTDGRGKVLNVYSIKRGYVDNECCVILRLYPKDSHCAIVFQFVSEEKWPINHHFQIIFVRSFWKNVRSWPMTDRYFKPCIHNSNISLI